MLIKKDLTYRIIKNNNKDNTKEPQYIIIKIYNVYIIAIYIPPTFITNNQFWKQLIKPISAPFLVFADFNIHHQAWGSTYTTREGEILYDLYKHRLYMLK